MQSSIADSSIQHGSGASDLSMFEVGNPYGSEPPATYESDLVPSLYYDSDAVTLVSFTRDRLAYALLLMGKY
jgi:hypothetical protein